MNKNIYQIYKQVNSIKRMYFFNSIRTGLQNVLIRRPSSERKRVVLLMGNVKLSPCGFLLRKRGKLNLANFRFKLDRSENPTSKISRKWNADGGNNLLQTRWEGECNGWARIPQQAPEVSWTVFFFFQNWARTEDATRFQRQSIDTSVRELPQKETERAISEDFPAAYVYGNLVSLFKNLEGKPKS